MEQLRLLIVDDERDFLSALAERLKLRGFQVVTAESGAGALKRVGENDFHVLVLDVKMPGIDGLELMGQIKAKHPDLPVILLTGHGSVADAERGMEEGAFDYLMKPIDIEELVEKISSAAGAGKGQRRE
jgi:DNA-binding NtrC family response regulator